MSKSLKLKNDYYLDSSSIVDNRKKLSDMLNGTAPMGNVVVDSIRTKNLFDANAISTSNTTNWAISFNNNVLSIQHKTSNSDGVPHLNLGKIGAGTYILSGTISGGHIDAVGYYKNGTYQTMLYNNSTFTITDSDRVEFYFTNNNTSTTTYTNLQLEKGSSATTYAKYQGLGYDICEFETPILNGVGANLNFQKVGRVVYAFYNGDLSSIPAGSFNILTTAIPTAFRPLGVRKTSIERSNTANVLINVNSDGTITGYNYDNALNYTTNFQFSIIYIV